MILLLVASVLCWLTIVESLYGLVRLSRAVGGGSLDKRSRLLDHIESIGRTEALADAGHETSAERRKRINEKMQRASSELLREAEGGLPNLAVISSVAPFIGLLGTVYGIMGSFVGIATSNDTGLAAVAPGIAEALAATAYGLAAAIPAAIGYNRIGAAFGQLQRQLRTGVAERAFELACNVGDEEQPEASDREQLSALSSAP